MITHDLGVIAETAQRVVVMYAGRKIEETDVVSLFKSPLHPCTHGLLRSVPHLEIMTGVQKTGADRLAEIPGIVPPLTSLPEGCAFAPRCPHADDKCRQEFPPYEKKRDGHWVACWHAKKIAGDGGG